MEATHKQLGYKRQSDHVELQIRNTKQKEIEVLEMIDQLTIPLHSGWKEEAKIDIQKGFMCLRKAMTTNDTPNLPTTVVYMAHDSTHSG